MGKVLVSVAMENLQDVWEAADGKIPQEQIRRIEVNDALVDTGATMLLLPKKYISQLGLRRFRIRQAKGLGGTIPMPIYSAVRLSIQGRDCNIDVGEVNDDFPVIVGQIPLEMMDWVVDPRGQKLIGNPEHGGEQIIEVF
jgi:predicted aspartyl protease